MRKGEGGSEGGKEGKGNLGKILAVEKAGKIPREGRRDRGNLNVIKA